MWYNTISYIILSILYHISYVNFIHYRMINYQYTTILCHKFLLSSLLLNILIIINNIGLKLRSFNRMKKVPVFCFETPHLLLQVSIYNQNRKLKGIFHCNDIISTRMIALKRCTEYFRRKDVNVSHHNVISTGINRLGVDEEIFLCIAFNCFL